jgi:glucose/mannose-6-phosphate isomerase
MINGKILQTYDKQNMHKVYDEWPEISERSFLKKFTSINFGNVDHIVFAGMGGSGAIGDIMSSIFSKSSTHVSLVKGFILPQTVNSKTLVVAISISGNTKETLAVLDSARKLNCNTIAFSSGGKMKIYCKKYKIKYINVEKIHSPRASFPSCLFSILKVMNSIIPIKNSDVLESIIQLKNTRNEISSKNMNKTNQSLTLSKWIKGIPMIYYPWGLQASAIRFKNSLQENVKMHAMAEDVVEACHNSIVSWEKKSKIQPILIIGKDDYAKTKKRWKVVKKYFKENNIEFWEITSINGNILSKLINLIYVLDYCSIYKAVSSKIDPTPVKSIDFIKKIM